MSERLEQQFVQTGSWETVAQRNRQSAKSTLLFYLSFAMELTEAEVAEIKRAVDSIVDAARAEVKIELTQLAQRLEQVEALLEGDRDTHQND